MRSVTVWIFIVVLIAWTISETSAQDKKKEEEKKKKEEEIKKKEEEKKKKEAEKKKKEAEKTKKEEQNKKKEEEKKKKEMEDEDKPKFIYRFVGFISEDDVKRSMLRGQTGPYPNPGNPFSGGYPMNYYG